MNISKTGGTNPSFLAVYEYKVPTSTAHACEKKLNELGRDGWRLVKAEMDLVGSLIAILEREIKE